MKPLLRTAASLRITVVLLLLLLQGVLGYVQWELELPTEIVWFHVAIATFNWLAMLWTIAAAGRTSLELPELQALAGTISVAAHSDAFDAQELRVVSNGSASVHIADWPPAGLPRAGRVRGWSGVLLPGRQLRGVRQPPARPRPVRADRGQRRGHRRAGRVRGDRPVPRVHGRVASRDGAAAGRVSRRPRSGLRSRVMKDFDHRSPLVRRAYRSV